MLIFNVIKRYFDFKSKANQLKDLAEKNKIVPRIVFVGGISRPGDKLHLMQIKFLINVSNMLENDQDTRPYLRLIFLPNYSTSKEYLYVPSLDVNEQLTIPGKQSCTT
jgi:starch phosphorylase